MSSHALFSIKEFLGVLKHSKHGKIGLALLAIPLTMALFADIISPYSPWERTGMPFESPSIKHPLGTNDIGQDLLSELIYGSRISMLVGFTAAIVTVLIGVIIGLIAGYFGGIIDEILMTITDIILLMPGLPLMILLAAFLGQGYQNIILVISIIAWPGVARIIRAQVLSIKASQYIESAIAIGASSTRIIFKHILPQVLPLALANIVLRIGGAMIAEASISFLGLGDPTQKSWGMMLYWAQRTGALSYGAWWWIIPPGAMIVISVLGFTQLGYAIEEWLNPKLRGR